MVPGVPPKQLNPTVAGDDWSFGQRWKPTTFTSTKSKLTPYKCLSGGYIANYLRCLISHLLALAYIAMSDPKFNMS